MPVDQELSALATVASLLPTDIIYLVRDPGGVAEADNKAAVSVIDARYASAAQGALAATALQNAAAFATAAQGATADTALQAAAIGVSVQAYNAGLSAITAFGYSLIDDVDAAAGRATLVAAGTGDANTFTAVQRFTATGATTLAGDVHAAQTGLTAAKNIAIDTTTLQGRNNGAASDLVLQRLGGRVDIGAAGGIGKLHISTTTDVLSFGIVTFAGQANDILTIWDAGYNNSIVRINPHGALIFRPVLGGSTNTVTDILTIGRNNAGLPATGYGNALLIEGKSSTTANQPMTRLQGYWATATHASRKARSVWSVYDTLEREGVRIEADGSAAMLGFYGSNAVAKQAVTGSRGGNAALADLLTKLATLGLITDSSSA